MLLLFRAWLVPYLPRLPGWLQALSEPVLQGGPAPNPSLWSLDAAVVVYETARWEAGGEAASLAGITVNTPRPYQLGHLSGVPS